MVAEAPVPVVVPRLVDVCIVIACIVDRAVETVDACCVAVIHNVLLVLLLSVAAIGHLLVLMKILAAGIGWNHSAYAVYLVYINSSARSIEHNAGTEQRGLQCQGTGCDYQ